MPPPKKPKNGPTTVEQFLSREELELQRMEEAPSGVAPTPATTSSSSTSSSSPPPPASGDTTTTTTTTPPSQASETGDGGGKNGEGGGEEGGEGERSTSASSGSSLSDVKGGGGRSATSMSISPGVVLGGGSGGRVLDSSSDPAGTRFRLLRQLFVQQEPDLDGGPVLPPAASLPQPRGPLPRGRNGDRASLLYAAAAAGRGGAAGCREHWPALDRSRSGGTLTSGASHLRAPAGFQGSRSCGAGRPGGGGSSLPGAELGLSSCSKNLMERSYLTSLITDSPPASSGARAAAASYLERAALTSGTLLQGVKGPPAPPHHHHAAAGGVGVGGPKFIHAAFQLPLMDTSTSGQAVTGPLSTSMLAYLAAQGAHPHPHSHSPLPPLPPSLPRCCGPSSSSSSSSSSSLPLVDANTSALTSFSSSSSSSLSLSLLSSSSSFPSSLASSGAAGSAAAVAAASRPQQHHQHHQLNEPFDLSVKKLSGLGGSLDSDSTGSDKTSGDRTSSSSRPGSGTEEGATGMLPPSSSSSSSTTLNGSTSTSTSPAVASTAPGSGDKDGSTSPALPRGVSRAHFLMDFRAGGNLSSAGGVSPLSRLAHDMAGAVLSQHRGYPGIAHTAGSSDSSPSGPSPPGREPSDNKASGGDISQVHSRLASGAPSGASPAGGGAGPSSAGVLGMPGHSVMSTSAGGHLQAPTSTTPESSGLGVAPSFFPMEPPLSISEIKQEIPAGSSTPAKLCQVCNDNASGFHYGVWSCEGCKAFFKRSIQGPVDYMCPATNNCTIDKHRRKSCQACRLRKCYEVGMNKGSQRKDRKSSGGSSSGSSTPRGKRCRADSTDAVNSTSGAGASKSVKRSQSAPILEALQKADLPVLESYHNHDQPLDRVHLLNTLIKLADRELVYLINWAKHVPGYTDLSLSDQVHLIECCWMELLLLNCAFRSMDYDGRRLVFAPDFHLDRPLWVVMGMTEILEQVSAVTEQMVQYAVTKEELLLLKATILVNAEARRLASYDKIMEMRQMIVDALTEVAQKSHPEDSRRVPSLLLMLTHVRQAGERGIAYFQALKHGGCVAFCDLLTEMLDAHNSATSAATAAASSSTAVTASMPSTSSTGIDQKTLSLGPPHLPQGPS